jgi:hypothetical protein
MPFPYTPNPLDAYIAAQTSVALAIMALLWFRPWRPWPACIPLALATWMAALSPLEPDLATAFGFHLQPGHLASYLRLAAALATLATAVARPRWLVVFALAGEYALARACDWAQNADWELAALHLAWIGVLIGANAWANAKEPSAPLPLPTTARRRHDVWIFVGATLLAAVVASAFELRMCGSGDEWANTYQADLFGHFKAYAHAPPCKATQQMFWVFFYQDRAFAQYTPGWPLFMAPFQLLGVPWLAGPVMTGIMAVGVARLARRAAAAGIAGVDVVTERHVRAAGVLAAVTATLGPSMLLNGGSRYPHPMICACLAWSIEGVCALASPDTPAEKKTRWGLFLGTVAALFLACRPADGGMLGPPLFLYFLYALARRRMGWRPLAATLVAFGLWAALVLVILRLQLGAWFKTGYDITEVFHPWARLDFRPAQPGEIKHVVPLATGAYMWWPAAPALGMAGLLATRGAGRAIAFMLGAGACILFAFYYKSTFAHSGATGYGPRLHLALVVAMAVGGAVALAPLWVRATRHATGRTALATAGPAALVALAIALGVLRVAPLVYPSVHAEMMKKTAPLRAIQKAHLKHAVVTVTRGETAFDPLDLLQNVPTAKDPDVIILHDFGGPDIACSREQWKDRTWWHAKGMEEAELVPLPPP